MINSQLGTDPYKFEDDLLSYFTVDHGNILYVPSRTELLQEAMSDIKKGEGEKKQRSMYEDRLGEIKEIANKTFEEISSYHSTTWL